MYLAIPEFSNDEAVPGGVFQALVEQLFRRLQVAFAQIEVRQPVVGLQALGVDLDSLLVVGLRGVEPVVNRLRSLLGLAELDQQIRHSLCPSLCAQR
jgi:hypothetical protein